MTVLKLVLTQEIIDKYNLYYAIQHPRAKKKAFDRPIMPSINKWSIMQRLSRNALKQKWKDLIVWWIESQGLTNLGMDRFIVETWTFMPTKRIADIDNFCCLKFVNDGFTESGLIVEDNYNHEIFQMAGVSYDKDNPRTEFTFYVLDEEENNEKAIEEIKEWKLKQLK